MGVLTFVTMGTVASLTVRDTNGLPDGLARRVQEHFRAADERFSLYTPDSELSRVASGAIRLDQTSAELRELYAAAMDWSLATAGAFTPNRPDGVVDLSGIVKSWAMEQAAQTLRSAGLADWCFNVGGDVLVEGCDRADRQWVVGIVDPEDRSRLLATVGLLPDRGAMATSGSAERGDHIWRQGDPAEASFVQASVIAADIITADVLATAVIAAGPRGLDEITDRWPIDVLTVDADGGLQANPGMRNAMTRGKAVAFPQGQTWADRDEGRGATCC